MTDNDRTGPLRVLYSFPGTVGKHGIGTTAYHQIRGVVEQGVAVTLYCTHVARELPMGVDVVETMTLAGRRVPHRAFGVQRAFRYHDWRVARALRADPGSFGLVHCWPGATLTTAAAASDTGVPSLREVINTHTGHAFEVVAQETESLGLTSSPGHSHTFDAAKLAREEAEFQAVDVLSTQSEYAANTFIAAGYPADKIAIHCNGFDQSVFYPDTARRDPSRPLVALFAGSAEPRKGLHHALRAWVDSGVADRGRFIICGRFIEGYAEALRPWLEHPSVEIAGFMGNPAELMRGADVFVLPSVEEGSALVTYEAPACGCVLLVSDATGARCVHGEQGLVHPAGDTDALASHFALLDRDRELLARLRAGALAGAENATWERGAEELVATYRQCIDNKTKPDRSESARNRKALDAGVRVARLS